MANDSLQLDWQNSADDPEQVPLEPLRLGGDELNLAEFPFALLADRQPEGVATIEFSDVIKGKDGQTIERTWILTGSDEFGLPVASDEQVYVALMEITREQGFENRTIHTTRYDLIKRLGWPDKGGSYARLKGCLNRLLGVTITAKHAFWDKTKQRYVDVGFHIIDDYALYNEPVGRKPRGPARHQPLSYIAWNQVVFKSFQAGNLKQLDTGFYFGLRSAVARRLFRYLDKKRLDGKPAFRIGLCKLGFEKLGMSRNYYPSHIKQQLARAHKELIDSGFLEGFRYYRPGREAGEQVLYWFTDERHSAASAAVQQPQANKLVSQLFEVGVTASVAKRLVAEYGPQVQTQLAYLPYRDSHNPPAMLVEALRNDWAPPASYLKAQTDAQRARQAAEAERQRQDRRQQQIADRLAQREALRQSLESLSPTDRTQLETTARLRLQQDNPALAAHPDSAAYQIVLEEYISDLLEASQYEKS